MARPRANGIWVSLSVIVLSAALLGLQGSRDAYDQGYRQAFEGRTQERANLFYKFGYKRGLQDRSDTFPVVVAPGPSSPERL